MKSKRLASFGSALVLSLSSLLVFSAPHVFAATATWDGGGSDDNMTTAANWAGDVAPLAGDDLVFPANMPRLTPNNDFPAATSFNSITFSGAATSDSNYVISGNAMSVAAGITSIMTGTYRTDEELSLPITLSAPQTIGVTSANNSNSSLFITGALNIGANNVTFDAGHTILVDGVISGSGTITKDVNNGYLYLNGANTFSGAFIVNSGTVVATDPSALGTTAGSTTINAGADLDLTTCNTSLTVAENITLTGDSTYPTGDFPAPKLYTAANSGCSGGSGGGESYGFSANSSSVSLSGNVTLGSDVTFASGSATTTLSGGLSGNFKINPLLGYAGNLVINASPNTSITPNGTYAPGTYKKTLSDDQSGSNLDIFGNTEITVTGKRGDTSVGSGSVLKGTGSVGNLSVLNGGKVAPGMSPGCLNSGNLTFVSGSIYDFEVGGPTACTEYDQLKVTGTVDLGNGTLNTILYNGFKPVAGQAYTIISNDGSEAVTGTFNNLAEGATFTVGGYVLKISYKGGDGNDVSLSVQSVPATPNTGFSLVSTYPLQTFLAITGLAAAIALIARRYSKVLAR